jgi:VWFA-related protein
LYREEETPAPAYIFLRLGGVMGNAGQGRRRKIKILLPWLSLLLFVPGLCLQERSSGRPDEILKKIAPCAEEPKSSSQEKPPQKIPRYDAAAVVKLVPVRVLDSNGRPVTDLKKEDFVLYDNKEQKKITEFEVHRLVESGKALEEVETSLSTTPLPEINRKYFIFLDVQGSDINGIANAKKAALEFVETMLGPGDEIAVLSYGPMTGLGLVEYLTADKDKIIKAIERAKENTLDLGGSPGLLSPDFGLIPENPFTTRVQAGSDRIENEGASGEEIAVRTKFSNSEGAVYSIRAPLGIFARSGPDFRSNISELAKALQYIPGTKNIVLFSSRAIPKEIGLAFAASNTPVFAVNTQNWIMRGGVKEKFLWIEHPLKDFAQASGGHYFADVADTKTIAEDIQTISGNYYVLGYYVNEQWDGRLHQIHVKVTRTDCKALVQEGFYNPRPFAQWTDIEKKLQLYDLAFADKPASKGVLDVPMEPLFVQNAKGSNGLVLVKIAVDAKRGIPPGKTEIFTLVFDKDDRVVQAIRGELNLMELDQKTIYPYCGISLKPGEYSLRFVARDLTAGQAVVGNSKLTIPKTEPSGLTLYSPLLLVPGQEPRYIRLALTRRESERSGLIDFYLLLPKPCSPLVKTLEVDHKKILAVIPAEFRAGQAPKVNLEFRLKQISTGEDFPLETRILETNKIAPNRSAIILEINLPDLMPGDYALEITATDSKTQAHYVIRSSFTKR